MEDKKLKILAAGDLHGDFGVARRLADKASLEGVDLVVLAGDIYGYSKGEAGLLRVFEEAGHRVLFVPGNCDFDEDIEMLKEGRNIHGHYVSYGDVGILGIGSPNWKLALDCGDLDLIREGFARMKSKKKILVSHLHAEGTKAELFGFEGWSGDFVLRQAIEELRPDLVISAHIHEAEGIEDVVLGTRVVQVGRGGTVLEV